jgi:glutamate synthase (ferredoxin)
MDKILAERDGCGVGIIANLAGDKSHKVIQQALTGLGCMEHRGGCSADDDSGDGAGLMVQIPWKVIAKWAKAEKVAYKEECSGAGNVFFPNDEASAKQAREIVVETFLAEGLKVVGWRKMPLNLDVVGKFAKATQPIIEQVCHGLSTL